ncbi:putative ornithine decarboxylase [Aspergillus flavus]|uniref:Decarboxylase flvG n=5 Tax=Aspergillus subgen. Circumdati TaxID=2720871 RepID=FLVG_ASPFN|nr:unnamed protein product [Aspergillus oryzae RIB40]B8NHE2.1 RecName: Full=Decarboxylase flvG; AltName: Full=Flavunoidine biosynthesis cluster protein G [Aspergillus flavus NRRL3357]EIT78018.1 ornithine decarboxylase [Aspergillus oryzae 3.042]KAB8247762.1 pyridoxal-dependent decarboxylase [Aspergillus flavus]KDE77359.1 ornithine decarboxylase [Aspergillus oryzae 100-8]KAF7620598.1 hypothetical protein AFLA_005901 [Aspergillus flavus NRRL3357]QRD86580.1 putative ornithine decarboxylase [Asper|eukprot:EIT78018.1 ornithine decarboxylase [Aspergillus oryzae 3.042]
MPYATEETSSVAWFPEGNLCHSKTCGPRTNGIVLEAMKGKLSQPSEWDRSEPFCVMDLGYVYNEYQRWTSLLPDVKPFYAVKCNPDTHIIKVLNAMNSGFDCASRNEMELVMSQGVAPERIIFANPCKKISDLEYAQQSGVRKMTFDNEAELQKIRQRFPDAQLILRCLASDPSATYSLGSKFGASSATSVKLLQCAKSWGLSVVGVSFHIGSNAKDPTAFDKAIQNSREVFDAGLRTGHDMHLLDIGGGFSAHNFDAMASSIRQCIGKYFCGIDVEIVAEPGRYFAAGALTLACGIIGRRDAAANDEDKENRHMLYLNDGVYGTFICNIFEPGPQPKVLRASGDFYPLDSEDEYERYTIWGPTCDGTDCVAESVALPKSLAIDDWLYFPEMGAYSTCLSTGFNGFHSDRETIYMSSDPAADIYL